MEEEVSGELPESDRQGQKVLDRVVDSLDLTLLSLLPLSGLELMREAEPAKSTAVARGESESCGEESARADDGLSPPGDPRGVVG